MAFNKAFRSTPLFLAIPYHESPAWTIYVPPVVGGVSIGVAGTSGTVGVGGVSGTVSIDSSGSIGSLLISELDSSTLSLSSDVDSLSSALDNCDISEFLEILICSALRFGISSLLRCALTKINSKKGAIKMTTNAVFSALSVQLPSPEPIYFLF